MPTMVSGGCGFIGSYLTKKLVEESEEDVVVFDKRIDNERLGWAADEVKTVQGDATNRDSVLQAVEKNNIDSVFHLISLLGSKSRRNPTLAQKVNVGSLLHFLEVARITESLNKIIFTSSVAVYDPKETPPVKEESPPGMTSVYGATKSLCEFYGSHYHRFHEIDFRALRFTTIYGPGKAGGSTGPLSQMIEKPARGESIKVNSADAVTDWLYIKDAVKGLLQVWRTENLKHRIFNIGGNSHSTREVAEIVRNYIPDAEIELKSEKTFPWPDSYDYSRARNELGYKPSFGIKEGVKDFIKEVRKT